MKENTTMLHLTTLENWPSPLIAEVLALGARVKKQPADYADAMRRRTLMMIFEKPSLRTRMSFETGMAQMGGTAIFYDLSTSPLGAGKETISDMIQVVGRYVDLIMARLFQQAHIDEMARLSRIPVINGLTNYSHPCQILADLLTIQEHKGRLAGLTLAYLGDGHNNVTHSLLFGCAKTGVHVRDGCPPGEEFRPLDAVIAAAGETARENGGSVLVTSDPVEAARDADVVYTDSWMSYHIPPHKLKARVAKLKMYQVNEALMAHARPDAIFLNCLPAQRGYEQTAEVIDGPRSVVFDEAENRLHVQKAVMIKLLAEAKK
jgi:ornithine carbamoyltransferase